MLKIEFDKSNPWIDEKDVDVLEFVYYSARLARYHKMWTPSMELAWNPLNFESTNQAVSRWLSHFDHTFFPLYEWVDDWHSMQLTMIHIPAAPQSIEGHNQSIGNFHQRSLMAVMQALFELDDVLPHSNTEARANQLLSQLGISVAPYGLMDISKHVLFTCERQYMMTGDERYQMLIKTFNVWLLNCGNWFLDVSSEMGVNITEMPEWDDKNVRWMKREWDRACVVTGHMFSLNDMFINDDVSRQLVVNVINESAQAKRGEDGK